MRNAHKLLYIWFVCMHKRISSAINTEHWILNTEQACQSKQLQSCRYAQYRLLLNVFHHFFSFAFWFSFIQSTNQTDLQSLSLLVRRKGRLIIWSLAFVFQNIYRNYTACSMPNVQLVPNTQLHKVCNQFISEIAYSLFISYLWINKQLRWNRFGAKLSLMIIIIMDIKYLIELKSMSQLIERVIKWNDTWSNWSNWNGSDSNLYLHIFFLDYVLCILNLPLWFTF